jgi:hypothetical protein
MANPGGYDYQRRYYQVRHKPLSVHGVDIRGTNSDGGAMRTRAGLLAKVLEPVRTCTHARCALFTTLPQDEPPPKTTAALVFGFLPPTQTIIPQLSGSCGPGGDGEPGGETTTKERRRKRERE